MNILWLLSCYNGRVELLQQTSYDFQSLKYLLLESPQKKKKLDIPNIEHQGATFLYSTNDSALVAS